MPEWWYLFLRRTPGEKNQGKSLPAPACFPDLFLFEHYLNQTPARYPEFLNEEYSRISKATNLLNPLFHAWQNYSSPPAKLGKLRSSEHQEYLSLTLPPAFESECDCAKMGKFGFWDAEARSKNSSDSKVRQST